MEEHDDNDGDEDSKLIGTFSSLHVASSPVRPTTIAVSAPSRLAAAPKLSIIVGGGILHSPGGTGLPLIGCDMVPSPPTKGPGLALVHIG